MYGLLITYQSSLVAPSAFDTGKCLLRETGIGGYSIRQLTLRKFLNDKLFVRKDDYFVAVEGLILNLHELMESHECEEAPTLYARLYQEHGEEFAALLRGSFTLVFYDHAKDTLLVYADQMASKPVFYALESFCVSSSLPTLTAQMQYTQADEQAMLELLAFGYSPSCRTIISGVNRLEAGQYLSIRNGKTEVRQYHRFHTHPVEMSEQERIEGIDALFRQAMQRVIRKNEEYGLAHYIPLSGGLDSRMMVRIATELTQQPIHAFSYSQTGTPDETVAAEVADYLHLDWRFQALDGGDFLKRIYESVRRTDMQICYAGPAESYNALRELPFRETGIIPTGVGGDFLINTMFHRIDTRYTYGDLALTPLRYKEMCPPPGYLSRYENRMIHALYTRVFYCGNYGAPLTYQSEAESYSVFMDTDLMQFVLSIPDKCRVDYRLYDRWVMLRYPEMATFIHNGHHIGHRHRSFQLFGRTMTWQDMPKRFVSFLMKKAGLQRQYTMDKGKSPNPTLLWLEQNPSLRHTWDAVFEENIGLLGNYPAVQRYTRQQFADKPSPQSMMQALTLLAALREVFRTTDSE